MEMFADSSASVSAADGMPVVVPACTTRPANAVGVGAADAVAVEDEDEGLSELLQPAHAAARHKRSVRSNMWTH